ncbi:hypothetical protein SAMN04488132_10937 [Sediminibacterium ginsengisoli]|uniref:ATP synthase I chain n=2 Tax=Sediminibacterium ginsengisoli TaxID=413434 RepID=A0A1T4QQI4_9BACT|nr:hypothetical protein SAMN04488132_10937 [Sediminibacterium ginsengisoli]
MTKINKNPVVPVILVFIFANAAALVCRNLLAKARIDYEVLLVANLLLFIASLLSLYLQHKSAKAKNPHVMVRSTMAAMGLKLFGLGAALIVYIYKAGPARSTNAIFVAMGLYVLYTWLEVRITLKANKKKHAGN